jgi:hypothetical protein
MITSDETNCRAPNVTMRSIPLNSDGLAIVDPNMDPCLRNSWWMSRSGTRPVVAPYATILPPASAAGRHGHTGTCEHTGMTTWRSHTHTHERNARTHSAAEPNKHDTQTQRAHMTQAHTRTHNHTARRFVVSRTASDAMSKGRTDGQQPNETVEGLSTGAVDDHVDAVVWEHRSQL